MNRGSITLDVLLCINITFIIVFMVFNSINMNEKITKTVKRKIYIYESDINYSYQEIQTCELEECIAEDIIEE
jgi:hypothetical protein